MKTIKKNGLITSYVKLSNDGIFGLDSLEMPFNKKPSFFDHVSFCNQEWRLHIPLTDSFKKLDSELQISIFKDIYERGEFLFEKYNKKGVNHENN